MEIEDQNDFETELNYIKIRLNKESIGQVAPKMVSFFKKFKLAALFKLNHDLINYIQSNEVPSEAEMKEFYDISFPYIHEIKKNVQFESEEVKNMVHSKISIFYMLIEDRDIKPIMFEKFDQDYIKTWTEFCKFKGIKMLDPQDKKLNLDKFIFDVNLMKKSALGSFHNKLAEDLETELNSEMAKVRDLLPNLSNMKRSSSIKVPKSVTEFSLNDSASLGRIKTFFLDSKMPYLEGKHLEYKNYRFINRKKGIGSSSVFVFEELPENLELKLLETITCFLNQQGGRIFIGVEDNNLTILGIVINEEKIKDHIKLYLNKLRKRIEPDISNKDVSTCFIPLSQDPLDKNIYKKNSYLIKIVIRKGISSKIYTYKGQEKFKERTDCSNDPLNMRKFISFIQNKTKLGLDESEESNEEFNRKHYPDLYDD